MGPQYNSGVTDTTLIGNMYGCGTIWYSTNENFKILYLAKVMQKNRVNFVSSNEIYSLRINRLWTKNIQLFHTGNILLGYQ